MVVEYQDNPFEILWNFSSSQLFPQILLKDFENHTTLVHSNELKDYEKLTNLEAFEARNIYQK